MSGWIKLHRQITKSSKFADPDILRLWILCLTKATHKETMVVIEKTEIPLEPGQFVTGRFSLSDDYNSALSPRKKIKDTTLWSWLKRLEEWGDLDIKSSNKYSVVSILKWSEYQESLTTELQQTDNKLTTKPQQTDTNKNVKNLKNEKNVNKKDIKKEYADYVFLTETEYDKLTELLGEEERNIFFLRFASWISGQTKRVQESRSAYLTILNWHKDSDKRPQRGFSSKPGWESKLNKFQDMFKEAEVLEREAK